MNTYEATEQRDRHVLLAKQLSHSALRLGELAKQRQAECPGDPAVKQSVRVIYKLAEAMARQIELAQLYDSFSKEVPENVLTDRLR